MFFRNLLFPEDTPQAKHDIPQSAIQTKQGYKLVKLNFFFTHSKKSSVEFVKSFPAMDDSLAQG